MADELSWEDIFTPKPSSPDAGRTVPVAPSVPAVPPPASVPAPPVYPPTAAFPVQSPPAGIPLVPTGDYRDAANEPADPFEALFGDGAPLGAPAQSSPAAADPLPLPPVTNFAAEPPPLISPDPAYSLGMRPSSAPAPSDYTPDPPFPVTAAARFTPRDEDDAFAAIFGGATAAAALPSPPSAGNAPLSRREARELEARQQSGESSSTRDSASVVRASAGPSAAGGSGVSGISGGAGGGAKPPKKRRFLWLKITLPIVIVLAAVGGVGAYGWFNYNHQVRALLGIPLPVDYKGTGNGEQVVITIQSGDIGSDIARTLHDKGVTMTFDSFYTLLLAQKTQPNFQPGNYSLQKQMSAQSALDALLNPANKITDKLLITEGTTLPKALEIIAQTTGIALADLQAASKDLASFGVPAEAPSLEGYLFPATYQLDAGLTAHDVLKLLVDTMFQHLDKAGVAPADRHKVLTMAALIQREAGPNQADFYKISRVFKNRLDQGINFESDATVAYGTGNFKSVFTTDAERADASNPYNTYVHPGLPIGPIGLPGDLAIDAALHPADGAWLFFVPINLATGETVFSETVSQHDAAVQQLRDWCAASPENGTYCQ